jgi:hypothetical protein
VSALIIFQPLDYQSAVVCFLNPRLARNVAIIDESWQNFGRTATPLDNVFNMQAEIHRQTSVVPVPPLEQAAVWVERRNRKRRSK